MNFSVSILGSNSAVPAYNRHPSAQILHFHSDQFLLDCGEGTQFQMNRYHIKRGNLHHVFISHLHGDHYFGLIGLLNTLRLNGRTKPITIHAPAEIEPILFCQMGLYPSTWPFEVKVNALSHTHAMIYEDENIEIWTIPLNHKIECNGFLFKEKPSLRKIIPEKIETYQIPYTSIPNIKKGADFMTQDNRRIPNAELTLPPPPPRSYAYCTDTRYDESIIPLIEGVNVLYHEATFLQEFTDKATERYHATAKQAAMIAKQANVKKLLIGHFSARYQDLSPFLAEAGSIFSNTELAVEGNEFEIER